MDIQIVGAGSTRLDSDTAGIEAFFARVRERRDPVPTSDGGDPRLVERLLDHPGIDARTGVACARVAAATDRRLADVTSPIDGSSGHRDGALPDRSLRFEHEHLPDTPSCRPVGTVDDPDDQPWTRIPEFKHPTGRLHPHTSIAREIPTADGGPCDPVPNAANEALCAPAAVLPGQTRDPVFVGRAQDRHDNLDQVAAAAPAAARRIALAGRTALAA